MARRTPQGVRGLKYINKLTSDVVFESHPARGAWIEMQIRRLWLTIMLSRTPQGVRGLKCPGNRQVCGSQGRTPQGVRGLKFPAYGNHPEWHSRTPQGVRGLKFHPAE